MSNIDLLPKFLYKYRAFSAMTMESLVDDKIYLADPSTFNDPLDSRPSLNIDIDENRLEEALNKLIMKRVSDEMSSASRKIKLRGENIDDHICKRSAFEAKRIISDIAYEATGLDFVGSAYNIYIELLGRKMEEELLKQYNWGIFSLAERFSCPLMWSHYGAQHNGLCIGYSTNNLTIENLHKVKYGGRRFVNASLVDNMLSDDKIGRRDLDSAVLLRKAKSWQYEKEWRLIGIKGLNDSPFELSSVTFGTRCSASVKYAVAKALSGREKPIRLYEMQECHGSFMLKRHVLDEDELMSSYPRRALSCFEGFEYIE